MYKPERPGWSFRRPGWAPGLTLLELLVVLAIVSILAAAALPVAEVTVRRSKELELRRALREIRVALDRLHDDWERGKLSPRNGGISADGYPKTLQVLVDGVELGDGKATKRKYLRQIPRDPFAPAAAAPDRQWRLVSYPDAPDALSWGGEDVYDVHSANAATASDGTRYRDW